MGNIRDKHFGQSWPPEYPEALADFDLSTNAVLSPRLLLDLNPVAGLDSDAKQHEGELHSS